MEKMKKLTVILLAIPLLSGCISYQHQSPTGETTKLFGFAIRGAATAIKTETKDDTYSRKVSVGGVSGGGDTETIQAIVKSAVEGAVEGG